VSILGQQHGKAGKIKGKRANDEKSKVDQNQAESTQQ